MNLFIFGALAITASSLLPREGSSEPHAGALQVSQRTSDRGLVKVHSALRREKRCSCSNMQDTECVYFCHVGIVWVNTPGQVVPYGLGSPLKRRKRELRRCSCTKGRSGVDDAECRRFCQSPTKRQRQPHKEQGQERTTPHTLKRSTRQWDCSPPDPKTTGEHRKSRLFHKLRHVSDAKMGKFQKSAGKRTQRALREDGPRGAKQQSER